MITRYTLLVFRYFLGLLFIATAIGKLLDNRGFAQVIYSYQLGIPDFALLGVALTFSFMELIIGLNILYGRELSKSVLATLGFHLGYAALAFTTLLRGIALTNLRLLWRFYGAVAHMVNRHRRPSACND